MAERQENIYAYPKTREFLLATSEAGVISELLEKSKKSSILTNQKRRLGRPGRPFIDDLNITVAFYASPESLINVTRAYSPNREKPLVIGTLRHRLEKTIKKIWEASPKEIQNQFPLEEIPIGKPRSTKVRRRYSESLNHRLLPLDELIKEGGTESEIRNYLKSHRVGITYARKVLESWGSSMPVDKPSDRKEKTVKDLSDPNVSLEDFKLALNKVGIGERFKLKKAGAIYSLAEICYKNDLHFKREESKFIRQVLLDNGINLLTLTTTVKSGKNKGLVQRYDFLTKRELDLSQKILREDQSLDRFRENPVKVIAGPKDLSEAPTSTILARSKDYTGLKKILKSVGVFVGSNKITIIDFVNSQDCPVPVYRIGNQYKISIADVPMLQEFALKRGQELGLSHGKKTNS